MAAGCASSPRPEITIHESPQGAVYLEPLSNQYLQAAHPISLPPETIARVLRGVLVQDEESAVQTLFQSESAVQPVFSMDDVTFLTPLLVTALSKTTSAQQVRFRVIHKPKAPNRLLRLSETGGAEVGSSEPATYGPQREATSGTLFAYGLSLYLTVTEYRQKPSRPDSVNMPNRRLPNSTRLDRVEFLFTPKAALRPESYEQPSLLGESRLTPIVIDYELLAKLPSPKPKSISQPASHPIQSTDSLKEKAPAAAPESPPPAESGSVKPGRKDASSADLQSVKELILKKDAELEALKEDLRAIKKQLAEQDAEREKPKKKKKPTPSASSANP
jgi:hypothetical protein